MKKVLKNIVYQTKNILVVELLRKNKDKCFIIGNGHSLSVDHNGQIIKRDPGMQYVSTKNLDDYSVYAFYFTFESVGLAESSYDLSLFVKTLSFYQGIFLVGHSKCGLCFYEACNQISKPCTLITISTPFLGTNIADSNYMKSVLKRKLLIYLYQKIFSNHAVDQDICPGSHYLSTIPTHCKQFHINVVSSIPNLKKCRGLFDFLLYYLDHKIKVNGDGIVSLTSQSYIEGNVTIQITASHATSLKRGLLEGLKKIL